ncbi:hypothetical protein [Bradyrhizobium cosmicum]|uniref:hypothetical protein n=1 Tax=Bradyrhizobium cosmicum TaxID=1404864 RepID=UPI0028EA7217|nr:hypothetical protein [Bradyrhizobium cosmicum]
MPKNRVPFDKDAACLPFADPLSKPFHSSRASQGLAVGGGITVPPVYRQPGIASDPT